MSENTGIGTNNFISWYIPPSDLIYCHTAGPHTSTILAIYSLALFYLLEINVYKATTLLYIEHAGLSQW